MKKFFVIVLMLMMVLSVYAAIEDEPQGKVELVLDLEELPPTSEKIEVGFSSVPVATFNDSLDGNTVDTITLTADPATGEFNFMPALGSNLYVYARLQTPRSVNVKFSGSELSGYSDAESASADPEAGLDWVISRVDDAGNTDNAPKSFSQTFSGTTALESDPIFEHRSDGSGKTMDIYCMAIDISSADEDYRQIAMSEGVNYWKTTLTVGVETTN